MMRPTTGISNTDAFARNRGQRPENARNCPTARGSALEMWFATKIDSAGLRHLVLVPPIPLGQWPHDRVENPDDRRDRLSAGLLIDLRQWPEFRVPTCGGILGHRHLSLAVNGSCSIHGRLRSARVGSHAPEWLHPTGSWQRGISAMRTSQ